MSLYAIHSHSQNISVLSEITLGLFFFLSLLFINRNWAGDSGIVEDGWLSIYCKTLIKSHAQRHFYFCLMDVQCLIMVIVQNQIIESFQIQLII